MIFHCLFDFTSVANGFCQYFLRDQCLVFDETRYFSEKGIKYFLGGHFRPNEFEVCGEFCKAGVKISEGVIYLLREFVAT